MKKLKIVFMGTPIFACSILEKLIQEKYEVVLVVSQPDKKVGRKQIVQETEVKKLALAHHIPVFQPTKISEDFQRVLDTNCDLIVTCAYGQMIPLALLEFPTYGSLNVHASLLPRLRGGAPIQKALIYGEKETGVSIMRMVAKMDAGDYMLQKAIPIAEEDTYGTLHDKLIVVAREAIVEAIELLQHNKAVFTAQNQELATFAYTIKKEEEQVDLSQNVMQVYNQIRGLIPFPVSYIMFDSKKLKIHKVVPPIVECTLTRGLYYSNKQLYLACEDGVIELLEVQVEGKKKMDASAFINGFKGQLIEIVKNR